MSILGHARNVNLRSRLAQELGHRLICALLAMSGHFLATEGAEDRAAGPSQHTYFVESRA